MKTGGQEIYVGPLGRHSCHLIKYFEVVNYKINYHSCSYIRLACDFGTSIPKYIAFLRLACIEYLINTLMHTIFLLIRELKVSLK